MYKFLLNMWVMRKCDEAYLQAMVDKGRISQLEYETIIATEQIDTGRL